MNTKLQWIFTQQQLSSLQSYKNQLYSQQSQQKYDPSDQQLTINNNLYQFIRFMRSRNQQPQYPLKFQKVIYYAVSLFKRFYLINTLYNHQPIQNIICAVYISLKLNQYNQSFITKMSSKWSQKDIFSSKKLLSHYNQKNYTKNQMFFLSGINFKTSLSKLIQPLQSIYQQINQIHHLSINNPQPRDRKYDHYKLIKQIQYQLDIIYIHPNIIFMYQGSKIALAIIVEILERNKYQMKILGKHLEYIVENNIGEINKIRLEMNSQVNSFNINLLRKSSKIKKMEQRKYSQSPKFEPKPQTFPNQE